MSVSSADAPMPHDGETRGYGAWHEGEAAGFDLDAVLESADPVVKAMAATVAERGLTPDDSPKAPILLMVSGGSDSTAMCLAAHELSRCGALDPARITVLHVDHGLRGEDSDNDALFVERLAVLCGFGFELRRVDVGSALERFGGNVENAARNLRYEAANELLDRLCERAGVDEGEGRMWVAHTQDDRVETFFMRAIVGTGPGGFTTIRYANGRIVRPLLATTREELRAYITRRVLELGWRLDSPETAQVEGGLWREDATNLDTAGFRSFVRHELVPVARLRNPSLGRTLSRTIDLVTEENDAIDEMVEDVRRESVSIDPSGRTVLDIHAASERLQKPFLRRLVYSLCKESLPVDERIELRHIDILMSSMDRPGFSMDLPGAVHVWHDRGKLVFGKAPEDGGGGGAGRGVGPDWDCPSSGLSGFVDVLLPVPGCVELAGGAKVSVSQVEPVAGRSSHPSACRDGSPEASQPEAGRVCQPDAGDACLDDGDVDSNVDYAKRHSSRFSVFVDETSLLAAISDVADGRGASTGFDEIDAAGRPGVSTEGDAASPTEDGLDSQTEGGAASPATPCLRITHRRDGDVLCPLGMHGSHKLLSDVFADKKVERSMRDEALVLRAGEAIVWVAGVVQDERFKVTDGSPMLRIDVGGLS